MQLRRCVLFRASCAELGIVLSCLVPNEKYMPRRAELSAIARFKGALESTPPRTHNSVLASVMSERTVRMQESQLLDVYRDYCSS